MSSRGSVHLCDSLPTYLRSHPSLPLSPIPAHYLVTSRYESIELEYPYLYPTPPPLLPSFCSRGLLGIRGVLNTATRGTAVMHRSFQGEEEEGWDPFGGVVEWWECEGSDVVRQ